MPTPRHHRVDVTYPCGSPDCLQFHVLTGATALQLDHHKVAATIDGEQVDTAFGVGPVCKLLGNYQQVSRAVNLM